MDGEILQVGCSHEAVDVESFGIDVQPRMQKYVVVRKVKLVEIRRVDLCLYLDDVGAFSQVNRTFGGELQVRIVYLENTIEELGGKPGVGFDVGVIITTDADGPDFPVEGEIGRLKRKARSLHL